MANVYRSRQAPGRPVSRGRARVPGSRVPDVRLPPARPRGRPYPPRRRRVRPRWGRIALVLLALAGLVTAAVTIGAWGWARSLDSEVDRSDPFGALRGGRPARSVEGALNILLLGTDSRDPDAQRDAAGAARTDTIMLVHVPRSHDKAYLISIPRDLYVHVPRSADGKYGDTRAKINAAFAWGGGSLMVQTMETFTGVRMDHLVVMDFWGFKEITDAVGGVDMTIERTITSIHPPYRKFEQGYRHLNGEQALDYIRQRKQFPEGDFARMRNQQQFVKALLGKATDAGVMTSPSKLDAVLRAATRSLTVDKDLSLVDLAIQFRGLRPAGLTFLTSPNKGSDIVDGEDVVVSDKDKAVALYQAVARDEVDGWLQANPGAKLPG